MYTHIKTEHRPPVAPPAFPKRVTPEATFNANTNAFAGLLTLSTSCVTLRAVVSVSFLPESSSCGFRLTTRVTFHYIICCTGVTGVHKCLYPWAQAGGSNPSDCHARVPQR